MGFFDMSLDEDGELLCDILEIRGSFKSHRNSGTDRCLWMSADSCTNAVYVFKNASVIRTTEMTTRVVKHDYIINGHMIKVRVITCVRE